MAVGALRYPDAWRNIALRWQVALVAVFCLVSFGHATVLWGRFFGARTTAYAITDQRILIAAREPWLQVQSFGPEDVQMIGREGDRIDFAWGTVGKGGRDYTAHLRGVADPERVELLIIQYVRDDPPAAPH